MKLTFFVTCLPSYIFVLSCLTYLQDFLNYTLTRLKQKYTSRLLRYGRYACTGIAIHKNVGYHSNSFSWTEVYTCTFCRKTHMGFKLIQYASVSCKYYVPYQMYAKLWKLTPNDRYGDQMVVMEMSKFWFACTSIKLIFYIHPLPSYNLVLSCITDLQDLLYHCIWHPNQTIAMQRLHSCGRHIYTLLFINMLLP